jgi:hypothetical protein
VRRFRRKIIKGEGVRVKIIEAKRRLVEIKEVNMVARRK